MTSARNGITRRLDLPGLDGARARLNAAIVRATNLAVAQEFDRGTAAPDILEAAEIACAVAIGGLAAAFEASGHARSRDLAARVAFLIEFTLLKHASGETQFTAVDVTTGGRA